MFLGTVLSESGMSRVTPCSFMAASATKGDTPEATFPAVSASKGDVSGEFLVVSFLSPSSKGDKNSYSHTAHFGAGSSYPYRHLPCSLHPFCGLGSCVEAAWKLRGSCAEAVNALWRDAWRQGLGSLGGNIGILFWLFWGADTSSLLIC